MTLLLPKTGVTRGAELPILPCPIDWMDPLSRDLDRLWAGLPGSTGGSRLIDWTDPGPNGKHGTLTNMDPATDWVPAGNVRALDYDGSDDYLSVPNFELAQVNFSIHMRTFIPSMAAGAGVLFSTGTSAFALFRAFSAGGADVSFIADVDGLSDDFIQSDAFPFGQHDWLFTYDGAAMRVYVNGALNAEKASTGNISWGTTPQFGRRTNQTFFDGQISSAAIWSRVVHLSEAKRLHLDDLAMLRRRTPDPLVEPAAVGTILPHITSAYYGVNA